MKSYQFTIYLGFCQGVWDDMGNFQMFRLLFCKRVPFIILCSIIIRPSGTFHGLFLIELAGYHTTMAVSDET